MDEQHDRQAGVAAGWGSAALAWIAEDPDRATDFELWVATYTGTIPVYKPGETLLGSLHAAKHLCAHLARALGV